MKVQVAVIGAGFAGIGAALKLIESGEESFVLLERADRVGGTWRDNSYPGVACDVPAHLYCFGFRPHPGFSRKHAPGAEIRDYLQTCVDDGGMGDRLRLGTELLDASWTGRHWRLTTNRGGIDADVLVLGCGRMTVPRHPDVPGLDLFAGPVVHSARWDRALDLTDRQVAVVGTGASAVQLVPELAVVAEGLTVMQRSAPYVLPRDDHAYSAAEQQAFADDPALLAKVRAGFFDQLEEGFDARVGDPVARAALRARALGHLAEQVREPTLRGALTPRYEFGCKRVLFSDDFYRALQAPHVHLAPALTAVSADGVVDADGEWHRADVLVLATGFVTAEQPYASLVHGRGGRKLAEHWSGGMRAYGSVTMPGFPNLVVLGGPNASLGHNSAVLMIEAQLDHLLGLLAGGPFEASPAAEDAYVAELDARSRDTVWVSGGCTNWYVDPRNGRQSLLWPGTAASYAERFGQPDPVAYDHHRWTVVVPLKPSAVAKSRLDSPDRAQLARAMALDTIDAALAADLVEHVVVVTADADLAAAMPPAVTVVQEAAPSGMNAAIELALAGLPAHHHRAVLLGDLPALTPAELDEALRLASDHDHAMVADADGLGTTLITARAGAALHPEFGSGSAARHRHSGLTPLAVPAPSGLTRDVDTRANLDTALTLTVGPRTSALVFGIGQRNSSAPQVSREGQYRTR